MALALITGASEGLGRALALQLASSGWDLVVDARRPEPLHRLAHELEGASGTVRVVPGDVTDGDHRATLVAEADALGGIDAVVCNAGTLGRSPLPSVGELTPADLRHVFEHNVVGPAALVSLALPSLRRRAGAVVAVTSDAAVEAYAGWGSYGASKAALEQLCHVLEAEEPVLRVYRFDPGDMRTAMHQLAFPGEDISDRPLPDLAAAALARLLAQALPSGRYRGADLMAGVA